MRAYAPDSIEHNVTAASSEELTNEAQAQRFLAINGWLDQATDDVTKSEVARTNLKVTYITDAADCAAVIASAGLASDFARLVWLTYRGR